MKGGIILRSGKKSGNNKRKVRSNKGKKRRPYGLRTKQVQRHASNRKVRSNKGKQRGKYLPRSVTRSGKMFRGGSSNDLKKWRKMANDAMKLKEVHTQNERFNGDNKHWPVKRNGPKLSTFLKKKISEKVWKLLNDMEFFEDDDLLQKMSSNDIKSLGINDNNVKKIKESIDDYIGSYPPL